MTLSNGNIFRVTGPLCGEFTGDRWIPRTKASDAELWCFFDLRLNKRLSKESRRQWFETPPRSLWRHCNDNMLGHYNLLGRQYFAFCWRKGIMMTSSNGNIFRVTGPLCGEFTGDRWIPRTKASDAELWCFFDTVGERKMPDVRSWHTLYTNMRRFIYCMLHLMYECSTAFTIRSVPFASIILFSHDIMRKIRHLPHISVSLFFIWFCCNLQIRCISLVLKFQTTL